MLRVPGDGRMAGEARAPYRLRLVVNPVDTDAIADGIRGSGDPAQVFRWFRILVVIPAAFRQSDRLLAEGDVVRKALRSTAAVSGTVLRGFADTVHLTHPTVIPFVAAAILVNKRVDLEQLSATLTKLPARIGNMTWVMALLSRSVVVNQPRMAQKLATMRQLTAMLLRLAGYSELSGAVGDTVCSFARAFRLANYGNDFRILTDKWTFSIGHQVILAYLIKAQNGGLMDYRRTRIWNGLVANRFLMSLIVAQSKDVEFIEADSEFAENHTVMVPEYLDGKTVGCFDACGIVADKVGDARGAILDLPTGARPILDQFLAASGLSPEDRIVTLHCRDSGYRRDTRHDVRNVEVENYLPAIRRLVDLGYKVIRVGDRSMRPLPGMPGVVDYATSPLKCPQLDVLLPGIARFHIGSSSGLSLVPLLFGVPCLFLNWYPVDPLPWGRQNCTVLKPVRSLPDGRRVVDAERYGRLAMVYERLPLNALGYDVDQLSAAEIERAVGEMAARLEGTPALMPKVGRNIGRVILADDGGAFLEYRPERQSDTASAAGPR